MKKLYKKRVMTYVGKGSAALAETGGHDGFSVYNLLEFRKKQQFRFRKGAGEKWRPLL